MTTPVNGTLDEQRRILREQMLAQREQIARQIRPAPPATGRYPRSKTMRFLTRWQGLASGVLAGSGKFRTGGRLAASLLTALTLARVARGRRTATRR